uniref:Ribosomal protein L18 n=1 Tax=Strongyloides papillosus TaxID=174720 RepID=A0A0N5BXW6_STREA
MINRNKRGHSYRYVRVRGSKAIRYRPSSNRKLCLLVIIIYAPSRKRKSFGSGGSMVAKLKLKGIDGRAPPGVEPAA